MSEEKAEAAAASGTPLAKAAERIRGSSQWLLGAFAAVGAVLAGGLQVTGVGDLSTDDWPRLLAGFGGILVAVIGIIIAITNAASASTKSFVSLEWLEQNPASAAAQEITKNASLRHNMTIADLRTQTDAAFKAASDTYAAIVTLGNPGSDTTKQAAAQLLKDRLTGEKATLENLKSIRADVLDAASYFRVKSAYDSAKSGMVVGVLLAAAGITAFAWGANPPAKSSIDGGDVLPKSPSEVTVILTDAGIAKFSKHLDVPGAGGCDPTTVAAIALSVSFTTYDVVSVQTEKCAVVRMDVTKEIGQVVPRVATKDAEATEDTKGK